MHPLYETLLKIAQDAANPAPSNYIVPNQAKQTFLKLLQNLNTNISGVSVENNAPLLQQDMNSLETLAGWLNHNQAKYQGQDISFPVSEAKNLPKDRNFVPMGQFSVWADGLAGFLKNLRDQAAKSNNPLFVEHISQLIQQANSMHALNLPSLNTHQEDLSEKIKPTTKDTLTDNSNKPASSKAPLVDKDGKPIDPSQYQQVGYKQISDTSEEQGQENAAKPFLPPFNLDSDIINIQQMDNFVDGVYQLFSTDKFKRELAGQYGIIVNQISQVKSLLSRWGQIVPQSAAPGGFSISQGENVNNLVQTYGGGDIDKSRDMFVLLEQIIDLITKIMMAMSTGRTVQGSVLPAQINRGKAYISRINDMISQLGYIKQYNAGRKS